MLVLMAIEDMLGDLGCTSISVAGNPDKALALIASEEFGLATLDGSASDPVAALATADTACYAAKSAGRNLVFG